MAAELSGIEENPTSQHRSFHEFYDPEHTLDEVQLIDHLVSARQNPLYIHGLGELAAHELLIAEGAHALLFTPENLGDIPFDTPPHRAEEIIETVAQDSEKVARAVTDTITALRSQEVATQNVLRRAVLPADVALAGMTLAASAYKDVFRKSGREYYAHPHEVATIIELAWDKFKPVTPEELGRLVFLAFTHDGFEEAFSKSGESFLATKNTLVSPLLVQKTFEALGESDTSHEVAHSLYLMSKPIGPDGNPMPYMDYIRRGLRDPRFRVSKLADTHHNLNIEPKLELDGNLKELTRIASKNQQYYTAQNTLLEAGEQSDNVAYIFMMHAVLAVTREEVRNHVLRQPGIHPSEAARLFEQHIQQIREAST